MATGEPLEVLDDSFAVDPESLRYAGGSVVWQHDAKQRSAPLR